VTSVIAMVVTLASMTTAAAAEPCRSVADLTAPAAFARYTTGGRGGRWQPADTRQGQARLYRTVLALATRGPPNFAARFSLVEIGCGAGAVCPAFVDRVTGRTWFEPGLRVVSSLPGELREGHPDYERLTYRRTSRLLVVIGSPNEEPIRAGAHLYRIDGGRVRRVSFIPQSALCGFGS
jgi:hypothetical protein